MKGLLLPPSFAKFLSSQRALNIPKGDCIPVIYFPALAPKPTRLPIQSYDPQQPTASFLHPSDPTPTTHLAHASRPRQPGVEPPLSRLGRTVFNSFFSKFLFLCVCVCVAAPSGFMVCRSYVHVEKILDYSVSLVHLEREKKKIMAFAWSWHVPGFPSIKAFVVSRELYVFKSSSRC